MVYNNKIEEDIFVRDAITQNIFMIVLKSTEKKLKELIIR